MPLRQHLSQETHHYQREVVLRDRMLGHISMPCRLMLYGGSTYSRRDIGTVTSDRLRTHDVMHIGYCSLRFYLHGNDSLKGKRKVIRAMRDRLKNKFNVSVSEVGDQDVWQSLHLGIVAVSSDAPYLDGLLEQVVSFVDQMQLAEMTACHKRVTKVETR